MEAILQALLRIGREEAFGDLAEITSLRTHDSVLRLADEHRSAVVAFARELPPEDRIAFIKAIAMLEDSVGGLGSVSNLELLLPLAPDPERTLFDWVLRNYRSYYYGHGARSIEEYDRNLERKAEHRAERAALETQRQTSAKRRIAEESTKKLFNAVRRGDVNAVRALLAKGADLRASGPDGATPLELATVKGETRMIELLTGEATKARDC